MTQNKKLTAAIRDRMARTGETYSTARLRILAKLDADASGGAGDSPPDEVRGHEDSRVLTAWVPDPNPRMLDGTLTRFRVGRPPDGWDARPLIVAPLGGWKILLPPGVEDPIQGKLTAPSAATACAYADDYLYRRGFTGPGIGPLPENLPPQRTRQATTIEVRSRLSGACLEEGAQCECGYIGRDIVQRGRPCPACRGVEVLSLETIIELTGMLVPSRG